MARCPKCGFQVSVPQKEWTMSGRPDPNGFRIVLTVALFNCPSCKSAFREVLRKARERVAGTTGNPLVCWNCRQLNEEGRSYCTFCGSSLERPGILP